LNPEFIAGMVKGDDDYLIILKLERILSSQELLLDQTPRSTGQPRKEETKIKREVTEGGNS
jgi:hypothetical protein